MHVCKDQIIDDLGRSLILRGCNLGGSSKLPVTAPDQGPLSLKSPADVSFTGRPFPLEEAEIHFKRLKSWGFTFLRFVITWEALEHAGPGIYDEEYLAYLRKIMLAAEKEGISVFIDPHQDVWSRWTGGDGAPAWTLEKIGMDLEKLDATGAAVTFQHFRGRPECGAYLKKDGSPKFFWPVNYFRYAAATMFTLFFGGKTYAPDYTVEGENIEDWLQEKYIAALRHCQRRLKNCGAIAGWGTMNEPYSGFIGRTDLSALEYNLLPLGPMPTPWEAMLAASGEAVKTGVYIPDVKGSKKTGEAVLNPERERLFREGYECPWKTAGVWTDEGGQKKLLKKDHFALFRGKPVNFTEDFLRPFQKKYIERMNDRPAIFFIEGIPQGAHPSWSHTEGEEVVNAFHYYDPLTVFLKKFMPHIAMENGKLIFGKKKAAACYASKLAEAREWTETRMGNMPCLLGEFGLPFDLNNRKAFKTGNYAAQEEAISRYYDGADKSLLHSTIWNYTAGNTNENGDWWNNEDFSIVCRGEGRAMKGWLRPYPMATSGKPLEIVWNRKKKIFRYRFQADPAISAPTELFIPFIWFKKDASVSILKPENTGLGVKTLRTEIDREGQRVFIYNDRYDGEVVVVVR